MKQHPDYFENAPDIENNREYIRELRNRGHSRLSELTGNLDVDAILISKLHKAKTAGIDIKINGALPPVIDWLDSIDIRIILGNVHYNAIEACERFGDGEIKVSFRYDDWLLITIENPTGCAPKTKKYGIGFIIVKAGPGHRLGLESITAAAERHDGHVGYKTTGGMFRLDIMLQQITAEKTKGMM